MVTKRKQHSSPRPVKQGLDARAPQPNKIGASTPYNFRGKNLTPYGGLLPVATLLERLHQRYESGSFSRLKTRTRLPSAGGRNP